MGIPGVVLIAGNRTVPNLATQLQVGSVLINRISPELLAPFGGVKQSGVGREFGVFGLQAFLEAKSIVSD
nr:aldehyde dehydrogenase family protein [Pseudomonas sp. B2021]